MKKLLFCNIVVLFFTYTLCFSKDSWDAQVSGTTQNLNSIFFLTTSTGFSVGNQGTLLTTTDGGNTWSTFNLGSTSNLRKVYFKSSSVGFILSDDGKIFKTVNGGSTWTNQTIHTSGLNGIDFNGENGIAVGDDGHVFYSSNAGDTWAGVGTISVFTFNDVKFLDATTAVLVGVGGRVFKTINTGVTWSALTSNTSSSLSSIELQQNNTYYITGTDGTILSLDPITDSFTVEGAGITTNWLQDITCNNSGYCYTAGSSATVLLNTDTSWETKNLDENVNLSSIYFADNNIGYACGSAGVLYKTVNGGVAVENTSLEYFNWQISPNPAQCKVVVNINNFTDASLRIYDALGNLRFTQTLETTNTSINIENLNSGVYIASLVTSKGVSVKKIIKN